MPDQGERYINPYTDFAFKKLFGTEVNKDLLISFLNALFMGKQHIRSVKYLPTEHFGAWGDARCAIFDVYCEDDNGGKFIVEMQNVYQQFFKDRTVFYSTFPIQEQAKRGNDWDFNLKEVYTVGILNFSFHDEKDDPRCYHHEVKLMDTKTKEVFYDKLTMIYLEMPKFNKTEDELETMFDKWLFVLRNLSRLFERPKALQEKIFTRLFEQAEIARFTPDEVRGYEDSVKAYRDINNAINTAKRDGIKEGLEKGIKEGMEKGIKEGMEKGIKEGMEKGIKEGMEKGIKEGKIETARQLKSLGVATDIIVASTGLTNEEVERI